MSRSRVELEYIFRASPAIVYTFITTSECLVRWFCDEVDIENDVYTFEWEGSSEVAYMVDDIQEERVRFIREDYEDGEFLEYRMYKSDITNETILEITDFCDQDEVKETKDYWNTLMVTLRKECGG
jgi:uncharacterized protein YndB with AHSA1/START domain